MIVAIATNSASPHAAQRVRQPAISIAAPPISITMASTTMTSGAGNPSFAK